MYLDGYEEKKNENNARGMYRELYFALKNLKEIQWELISLLDKSVDLLHKNNDYEFLKYL